MYYKYYKYFNKVRLIFINFYIRNYNLLIVFSVFFICVLVLIYELNSRIMYGNLRRKDLDLVDV